MDKSQSLKKLICVLSIVCSLSAMKAEADSCSEKAEQILDKTGVEGGFVVHLGCGDGRLTEALRINDRFLVHGLDSSPANVQKARYHIRLAGAYGPVSVERFTGKTLPYTDKLVNLLIAEDLGEVPIEEVKRVLVPEGVAYIKRGGRWEKIVTSRPEEMDEWTHYLYDPSGNAVSKDSLVDFLRQAQWIGGPRYGAFQHPTALEVATGRSRCFQRHNFMAARN